MPTRAFLPMHRIGIEIINGAQVLYSPYPIFRSWGP
jgi:hypothetical protein